MGKAARREHTGRLPPAAGAAVAAATASSVMVCGAILMWGALPEARASFALIAFPLILMPLTVAMVTWIVTQRTVKATLDLAVECVDSIAANDLETATSLAATGETAALALSLERCRVALSERQRASKIHAAVARVMGLAIGRLAEGDLSARITVELPPPYQSFRDDFNAAMERLQAPTTESGPELRRRAGEIREAAAMLSRRAAKLVERIDTDLVAIDAGNGEHEQALRKACDTLVGASIAARRNIEAAERFAEIGHLMEQEADRLARADGSAGQSPATDVPEKAGATIVKLVSRYG